MSSLGGEECSSFLNRNGAGEYVKGRMYVENGIAALNRHNWSPSSVRDRSSPASKRDLTFGNRMTSGGKYSRKDQECRMLSHQTH